MIIQYFIGYASNAATGAYVTMPTSFSNNRYTLVQAYYTSDYFMTYAMCPTWNYVNSTGSQCFLGVYNLQEQFWSKVIAIGF